MSTTSVFRYYLAADVSAQTLQFLTFIRPGRYAQYCSFTPIIPAKHYTHSQILETQCKFPLLRVDDTFKPGQPSPHRRVVVANQVMVLANTGVSDTRLQEVIKKMGELWVRKLPLMVSTSSDLKSVRSVLLRKC